MPRLVSGERGEKHFLFTGRKGRPLVYFRLEDVILSIKENFAAILPLGKGEKRKKKKELFACLKGGEENSISILLP